MSADGSDQDIKSKTTRRSGRPKKPRVVPEDEMSGDGKSDEEVEEPFEGSEEDDEFEEESRSARKKAAAKPKTAAPIAKGGKAAKKAVKEVEEDEEEDIDGDLEDEEEVEEEEEDEEGEEDEDEFSDEDSEEGADAAAKKKNGGGAKKKKDKNADAEAAMDRAQYFPNASFVIAKKDKGATDKVDLELWRIDGKCMLQKFVGYTDEKDATLKFKSTNAYTGWSALDKDDYMNVNVIIDPVSTQSKVIVTVDTDSIGGEAKVNNVDVIVKEDVK